MKKSNTKNNKSVIISNSPAIKINKYLPSKKEEFLDYHKSSLEILLDEIKNCQIKVIKNSKNKCIRTVLNELKEKLDFSLNEKNTTKIFLEKKISQIKKPLQIKNNKENIYINKKNINLYNLKSEIQLLKILNFKVENDIKQINNNIIINNEENDNLNLCMKYPFIEEKIIICRQQKYFPMISKLLHNTMTYLIKKLKFAAYLKQYQNDEIEEINQNITRLKNVISIINNSNIDNSNKIFQEKSKDLTNSISLYTLNNINSIVSLYIQMKQSEEDKKEDQNNIIIDEEDNIKNNKFMTGYKLKNKDEININDNKSNFQQFINLNMNINLNINYDKYKYSYDKYNYTQDIVYNSDRNIMSNKKYYNKIKGENRYSSSYYYSSLIYDSNRRKKKFTKYN